MAKVFQVGTASVGSGVSRQTPDLPRGRTLRSASFASQQLVETQDRRLISFEIMVSDTISLIRQKKYLLSTIESVG